MDLNKETAMRLWNQSFGKETKATDFSGRIIAKGAYNDRNSEYGWNVDHILPQSKGGKTADYNLICCHILTNDEKADSFPCFNANGNAFEIIKVQRHYEIRSRNKDKKSEHSAENFNFYDSAAGIRLFKSLKGIQNKKRFVGTVFIYLENVTNGAVVDFIEKIFDTENIFYENYYKGNYYMNISNYFYSAKENSHSESKNILITVKNYDMPFEADTSELLDKCILLNTYLSEYFSECDYNYIYGFDIYFREDYFDNKTDFFHNCNIEKPLRNNICLNLTNSLYINELIRINTTAKNDIKSEIYNDYRKYNYIFTTLGKNLLKEAKGE